MVASTETSKPAKATLPKGVFGVDVPNHELLRLAYESFLAQGRMVGAKTKTRGEVRGGGKKPWRQKGTGRARFGSTRNPIWRDGGIVFGPRGIENYTKKISTSSKRTALRQALTLANQAKKITVADIKTSGKTKDVVKFLFDNKLDGKKILVVVDTKTPEILRATNNINNVLLVSAKYLSVYYILNADYIVIANSAVKTIEDWLTKEAK